MNRYGICCVSRRVRVELQFLLIPGVNDVTEHTGVASIECAAVPPTFAQVSVSTISIGVTKTVARFDELKPFTVDSNSVTALGDGNDGSNLSWPRHQTIRDCDAVFPNQIPPLVRTHHETLFGIGDQWDESGVTGRNPNRSGYGTVFDLEKRDFHGWSVLTQMVVKRKDTITQKNVVTLQ